MLLDRDRLLAERSLSGAAWCRAYSGLVDEWLAALFDGATAGAPSGLALVAVGGYGRSELCPHSDLDVMLVHANHKGVAAVADHVWYPIWDEGLHLGHSVSTVRDALGLAADDLDTATALLSARHLGGDPALSAALLQGACGQWQRRSKRWLSQLAARVDERHASAGEVAFRLEPDLKDGRGGLRDVHSLRWAHLAQPVVAEPDEAGLAHAYAVLLDARVELHRTTGRATNVLALQEQQDVARRLGLADADALMARVAEAARTIAWTSDDTWRRVKARGASSRGPLGVLAPRGRAVGPGLVLRDGEVAIEGDGGTDDPVRVLDVALAAARNRAVIERPSLERLASSVIAMGPLPTPWPVEARTHFVDLLLTGADAVPVIEALDRRGIWAWLLPEWAPIRSKPQRNAYHRFTVDRHLLEAAAHASTAAATSPVRRVDLLVLAALFHDLGKGSAGDHTEIGMELTRHIAVRMGFAPTDVATLVALVEHHLLLSDVATRRDLDDTSTISRVAQAVGSVERLHLLAALTEADSLATGPAAWGPWKAGLVEQLVSRTAHLLEGGAVTAMVNDAFPTKAHLELLESGADAVRAEGDTLTVVDTDRPGTFSRVAGVLALHGLDVLAAAAWSTDGGRALSEFRVADPLRDETPWDRITRDLALVLDGRLALHARLAERVQTYGRNRPARLAVPGSVTFDIQASDDATVVDVETADGIGVLYRITRALAELDLDIRLARVQTMGHRVVDAFYIRDRRGRKIEDPATLAEIERAILHSLAE